MTTTLRWLAGLAADLELGQAEAVVVQVQGRAAAQRLARMAGVAAPLLHGAHQPDRPRHLCGDTRQLALLTQTWVQQLLHLLRQATDRLGVSWHDVLCVGLLEPWLVLEVHGGLAIGVPIPLAPTLAEWTGWSIAHGFALRDLAAGGQARPVTAAADALLFRADGQDRLILHLGEHISLHWLPRQTSWSAIRGTAVLPGLGLLNQLALVLTGGRESSDRSGHLAVQGRLLPELLARWQAHPSLLAPAAKPATRSDFGLDWIQATCQLARQRNWPVYDVLCTACHWLVLNVVQGLARLELPDMPSHIVVTGPGCRNGFLWHLLQEKFRPSSLQCSEEFGIPAESAQATRAALLAGLLLDQVPASVPQVTGSSGTRLLGQWTPGSLSNWSRCLHWTTAGCEPVLGEEA